MSEINDSAPSWVPSHCNRVQRTLIQYLNALKRSGIETIPKGLGKTHLEFVLDEAPSSPVQTNQKIAESSPGAVTYSPSANSHPSEDLKENSLLYDAFQTQVAASASSVNSPVQSTFFQPAVEGRADDSLYPAPLSYVERAQEMTQLSSALSNCVKCPELARCRSKVVFGTGSLNPRLVFLGEAPGADEDRQGEPFVGAAGQLLNRILAACNLNRSDVYILNTIKCRPPGNRNPALEELDNCWQYTRRQLEILHPEFICCLGLIATRQLLKTDQPLGRLRQKIHRYRDSKVIVTYHPAYLLRTESAKKHAWDDMKMLMREMAAGG
jgi:uracil-DNA glycosylase